MEFYIKALHFMMIYLRFLKFKIINNITIIYCSIKNTTKHYKTLIWMS